MTVCRHCGCPMLKDEVILLKLKPHWYSRTLKYNLCDKCADEFADLVRKMVAKKALM